MRTYTLSSVSETTTTTTTTLRGWPVSRTGGAQ